MKKRRTLQDLTIKDNFLFGAVMHVEENCKGFLELVLGFPIAHVVVSKEKSMIYHPEYKGVRLDIYAEDENHTHYNVEMQMRRKKALGKRSRYYHSQIVMEALESGEEYETIVIFHVNCKYANLGSLTKP
ncbi:MAG: Rpn family recombination-promoting nuclease/putative transposase [Clostridium sp.]